MADESSNSSAVRKPKPQAERHGCGQDEAASSMLQSYNLPDYRLEAPEFALHPETASEQAGYRAEEDLPAPAPPLDRASLPGLKDIVKDKDVVPTGSRGIRPVREKDIP
jgi:hypothetical protein